MPSIELDTGQSKVQLPQECVSSFGPGWLRHRRRYSNMDLDLVKMLENSGYY